MRVANAHIVSSDPASAGFSLAQPFQKCLTFISGNTLSASFTTPGIGLEHIYNYAVQVRVSGTISGAVSLWASCQNGTDRLPPAAINQTAGSAPVFNNQGITDWVQVAGSQVQMSASTTAAADCLINVQQVAYKWFQLQWTHNIGTGSLDAWWFGKGSST